MKKLLLIGLSILVLVGCGNLTNTTKLTKELNTVEVLSEFTEDSRKVKVGMLDPESISNYYSNVLSFFDEVPEEEKDEEIQAFIDAYSEFINFMVSNLELPATESSYIGIEYVDDNDQNVVYGMMIYVFDKNVTISEDSVNVINTNDENFLEYVYVKENILVTVDLDFIEDYDSFKEAITPIIEAHLENK